MRLPGSGAPRSGTSSSAPEPGTPDPGRPEIPPGTVGKARVGRGSEALPRRLHRGDVAVLDHVDLDRATASALVEAGVAGVVNVSPSISGRFPNAGPQILTDAGVALVDDVGESVLTAVKDGARVRLHDGGVHLCRRTRARHGPGREVARGFVQTPETVAELLAEARMGMAAQLEAFSANTTEFMGRERGMLLDGTGVPTLATALEGRHVLVVAPGTTPAETAAEVHRLRHVIRAQRPVLVGVGAGADALRAAGHAPAVLVGTATELDPELARRAVDVVVPADPDGHVAGRARMQDMGIEPRPFASTANPEDMALLIAHTHGAGVVITVGFDATLGGFLDRGRSGRNASTFLTRLRLGPTLVDSATVVALHRRRVPAALIALLVLAIGVAVVAVAFATGFDETLRVLLDQGVDVVLGAVRALLR